MSYRILTFDGGGICGLFTAIVLDRLSAQFPPLLRSCDLFAGTSTGGIIALCLAAGRPPSELATLYSTRGKEIFDDSVFDNILDLGKSVGADYGNKKLKRILTQEIFGQRKLRDLPSRVLVPAFDLDSIGDDGRRTWKPKFFHNYPGNDSDGGELCADVALRTSAAPTFFPAYQGYIDGGVVANNPSMAAVATALDPRAGKVKDIGDIVLLSISTGSDSKFIKGESLDWGWGQWARPLVSIMISGVMGVAHFQCKQILGVNYRRLDRIFDRAAALDDCSPRAIAYLREQANLVPIDDTVQWLRNVWK